MKFFGFKPPSILDSGVYASLLSLQLTNKRNIEFSMLDSIRERKAKSFITLNPHSVIEACKSRHTGNAYLGGDFFFSDGIGYSLGYRLLNGFWPKRLSGRQIYSEVLRICAFHNLKLLLLGGTGHSIVALKHRILKNYDIHVDALELPFFNSDEVECSYDLFDEIISKDPVVVLVFMTAPKQEIFSHKLKLKAELANKTLMIFNLGAVLDFELGLKRSAPRFVQKFGLEWVFRTITDWTHVSPRLSSVALFLKMLFLKSEK